MTTGSIDDSLDYEEPELPDDWGLMEAACADGQHRFLPDAPRCGCGEQVNTKVEHARLERQVIEKCIAEFRAGETVDRQPSRNNVDAYTRAEHERESAVKALLEFESQQK